MTVKKTAILVGTMGAKNFAVNNFIILRIRRPALADAARARANIPLPRPISTQIIFSKIQLQNRSLL